MSRSMICITFVLYTTKPIHRFINVRENLTQESKYVANQLVSIMMIMSYLNNNVFCYYLFKVNDRNVS